MQKYLLKEFPKQNRWQVIISCCCYNKITIKVDSINRQTTRMGLQRLSFIFLIYKPLFFSKDNKFLVSSIAQSATPIHFLNKKEKVEQKAMYHRINLGVLRKNPLLIYDIWNKIDIKKLGDIRRQYSAEEKRFKYIQDIKAKTIFM